MNIFIFSLFALDGILSFFFNPHVPPGTSLAFWGAVAGSVAAPVVGGLLSNFLGGGSTTLNQQPLEPAEVTAARQKLLAFANTGRFGNFTAGTPYTGSLGDFTPSDIEKSSLGNLSSYVQASPEIFKAGGQALQDLLSGDRFDPYSSTGEFAPFKANVERNIAEGAGRIKNNAAFGGSLYSTNTVKQIGQLEQTGQQQLTGKLADLYQNYVSSKTNAIPQALSYSMAPLQAGFQYGSLPRTLETDKANAQMSEYLRQRQELMMPIQAAQSVAGSPSNFGVPSLTVPGTNPFQSTINAGTQTAIQELIRQMFNQKKAA